MKASQKTAARAGSPKKASPKKTDDAIAMLRADHRKVSALFAEFDGARSTARKKALVSAICAELTVHASLEEEIFYPAVKAALKDKQLVPEATVEHASLKNLIAQVEGAEPGGEMYDAKVQVMSEYVKHHVKEEQNEMFPKARKTRLDMAALGRRMAQRKRELLAGSHDDARGAVR
jgi:hemerythrin superfamily protein